MKDEFSDNFKRNFLISITKEMIKHSVKIDIVKLENIIKSKEKTNYIKPIPSKKIILREKNDDRSETNIQYKKVIKESEENPLLFPKKNIEIPLNYTKPVRMREEEIELYKVSSLMENPETKMIIANPDEKVSIVTATGTEVTDLVLSREDINRIISSFSEKSKIPIKEGVYKVNFRNLTLSAIISEVIGSRFVIKRNSLPY